MVKNGTQKQTAAIKEETGKQIQVVLDGSKEEIAAIEEAFFIRTSFEQNQIWLTLSPTRCRTVKDGHCWAIFSRTAAAFTKPVL
ncbi:hypothetical protein FACS1894163_05530 [Spirochaetia bacterium]|nr:hypothetical protein FACS1894163_05530 [Spirochaetia bacterium]